MANGWLLAEQNTEMVYMSLYFADLGCILNSVSNFLYTKIHVSPCYVTFSCAMLSNTTQISMLIPRRQRATKSKNLGY